MNQRNDVYEHSDFTKNYSDFLKKKYECLKIFTNLKHGNNYTHIDLGKGNHETVQPHFRYFPTQ